MDNQQLKKLIVGIQNGDVSPEKALERLKKLPFEDLGYAKVDHHRNLRNGVPEVIYCQGKTVEQIQGIVERMMPHHGNILATRADSRVHEGILALTDDCRYHEMARIVVVRPQPVTPVGRIAVVCAGTSDIPVAEEAAVTAITLGNRVDRHYDVGVAGIHRLLDSCEDLFKANVAIAIAGMEGALASVVGGLVSCPVIGVPTSVGYGASFGGLAALLSMLNSCASGVSVVNIDNGFGAAYQASLINKLATGPCDERGRRTRPINP
ncbi:1-(5-phosphoribosyl)-5-amino-4-imidazole-carboxyl ate carboxylase [Desulfosarcina ovata subsp. sediminis]|uniref:1-(5-phosphoribosyl)-5-amino-4-imidazole-carboxyl ate carboxylase n=1 Tax=Desulfosarcina ovata subsp. sediminis TaxID=885957 RepID=A0A5K7ZKN2_9BACT|nr:nickel pincer cofactor biosynthesis protein LarB [Desulfosarcina ovata]BBO82798.1 1-(5-phosphoribosyl)-5-amino-4-imidazole-carboxyl ate carboxylase [Desulfosarcina ovata subsp. sediminis]